MLNIYEELKNNAYPGRGIVIGKSEDGKSAVAAYFIMGRSVNSRNRVFVEDGDGIRTQAFDPSKLEDPHLIIYAPVRVLGNKTIVTNGDQTDTIYELMNQQMTFEQSLRCREYEDDAPNYTPRISGIIKNDAADFNYALSILKSDDGNPDSCQRFTFSYTNPVAGEGLLLDVRDMLQSCCGSDDFEYRTWCISGLGEPIDEGSAVSAGGIAQNIRHVIRVVGGSRHSA